MTPTSPHLHTKGNVRCIVLSTQWQREPDPACRLDEARFLHYIMIMNHVVKWEAG